MVHSELKRNLIPVQKNPNPNNVENNELYDTLIVLFFNFTPDVRKFFES